MMSNSRAERAAAIVAKATRESSDFAYILSVLPPGQVKNLLKDKRAAEILARNGIAEK